MGEARNKRARNIVGNPTFLAGSLFNEAQDAYQRRDFERTRELCERIVEREPNASAVQHLHGLALLESGERERGVEALRKAVELEPGKAAYRFNLALAQRVIGDLQGAIESFAAVSRQLPSTAEPHYEIATTYEVLGETAAAEAAFRRAIDRASGFVAAHAGLARMLFVRDALEEAMAVQAHAAALDPRAWLDGRIGRAYAAPSTVPEEGARAAVASTRTTAQAGSVEALVAERELRVLDDFEPDFAAWREFALAQRYADGSTTPSINFPGLQTLEGFATPVQMQRIADAVGRDIKWRLPSNGAFRQSYAGSLARSDIHVDEEVMKPMYAGVLYLSLPEHCRGGTSFFRHRATGWSTIPSAEALRDSPYPDFRDFQRREILGRGEMLGFAELTRRRDAWESVLDVPMRANRLILFRSDYFHAISEIFGSSPGDSRLVQLFFFEPLDASVAHAG